MVTYFVRNLKDKEVFEKQYQVPYGYYTCPHFQTEDGAIGYVESLPSKVRDNTIVEKWEGGVMEIIYKGEWYSPELDNLEIQ